MNLYSKQWNYIKTACSRGRMPQAMLFVGPLDCALDEFTQQFMQLLVCKKKENKPCLECTDCQMLIQGEHCDITLIKPEKIGGVIKVDQIRELQHDSYLTPQRAKYRLILIESADRMNTAAANALLKILEEPAEHTVFVLKAEQLSTVLPTVLSRCQVLRFATHDDLFAMNCLSLGERYPQESSQAMIIKQSEPILDSLIAVIEKKEHPCIIAAQWMQFELNILLWFLYLTYSQVQIMQMSAVKTDSGPAIHQLQRLTALLNPIRIFNQIDKINALQRKLNHNQNVNHLLALEHLLLDLG